MPVMLIAIGFPTLSRTERVTLDDVPEGLLPMGKNGHSRLCDEAVARRDRVMRKRGGKWWFDREEIKKLVDKHDKVGKRIIKAAWGIVGGYGRADL